MDWLSDHLTAVFLGLAIVLGVAELASMDLILLMLALSVGITLFATILTAWSAASEKPLNVLRAE